MNQQELLNQLQTNFRIKITLLIQGLKMQGFAPHIICAWRSEADQLTAYKNKRSKVKFGFHNLGTEKRPRALAVDITNREPLTNEEHERWNAACKRLAENLDLTWGGNWPRFRDEAHFETRAFTLREARRHFGP